MKSTITLGVVWDADESLRPAEWFWHDLIGCDADDVIVTDAGPDVLDAEEVDEERFPLGPFGGFYTAPGENGYSWGRDGCDYGDEVGGDEAVSHGFVAYYYRPMPGNAEEIQRCDVSYYVYGTPGNYGVVENTVVFRTDAEGEWTDEDERSDEGLAPSFESLNDAMAYAKRQAENDLRFCLAQ